MTLDYIHAYRTQDKTSWGPGPWQHEIDKMQWIDPATGLDCLIVRSAGSGALCGYVGVPATHPWYGRHYYGCTLPTPCLAGTWCDHAPISLLDVHGGLTYSDTCAEDEPESTGICHIPLPGRPDNLYWFGYDCAHYRDLSPAWPMHTATKETYRTEEYVQEQCAALARQLVAVTAA